MAGPAGHAAAMDEDDGRGEAKGTGEVVVREEGSRGSATRQLEKVSGEPDDERTTGREGRTSRGSAR